MIVSSEKQIITAPADIGNIIIAILRCEDEIEQEKEHFYSIGMDQKNVIQYIDLVSLGTVSESIVHPRETFRRAVIGGVSSIIIAHNHPSGNLIPSKNDIKTTNRLVEAGKILGITVLDHVIVNMQGNYISLKESGYLVE